MLIAKRHLAQTATTLQATRTTSTGPSSKAFYGAGALTPTCPSRTRFGVQIWFKVWGLGFGSCGVGFKVWGGSTRQGAMRWIEGGIRWS